VVPVIFIAEHFFAPGRRQLGALVGKVLGVRRDAGIAVNHARILHHKFASKKRNSISTLVLMQISSISQRSARRVVV
jgi:hypothetical protein